MNDQTKNLCDVILTVFGYAGAAVAFLFTLVTWRKGQHWHRAEQLDKLVQYFEGDELLRVACAVLDWTWRTTSFLGNKLEYKNSDALGALRTPADFGGDPMKMVFPDPQATIRDSYDAFLSFLGRLAAALEGGLISPIPTERYFKYWVERFVRMDRHPLEPGLSSTGGSAGNFALRYVDAYGDPAVLQKICTTFKISLPPTASLE
jgi:hypothetical protein